MTTAPLPILTGTELRFAPLKPDYLEQSLPTLNRLGQDKRAALLAASAAAVDLEAAHRAESTRNNYGYAVRLFCRWCDEVGAVAFPVDPAVLGVYIGHLSITGGNKRPEGQRTGRKASTIAGHVNAICAMHKDLDLPNPITSPVVQRILRGLRRKKGVRPERREPMTLPRLFRVVRTVDERQLVILRDRLIIAADATKTPQLGRITPAQLSRLDWENVRFSADGGVEIDLSPRSRASAFITVNLAARPDDPLCLATALRDLHEHVLGRRREVDDPSVPGIGAAVRLLWRDTYRINDYSNTIVGGPVMPSLSRYGTLSSSSGASKATVTTRLSRAARATGAITSRQKLPDWSDHQRRAAMVAVSQIPMADLRDRALLLMGFALAARRSNLSMLLICEITETPDGLLVFFRKSKVDQEGRGRMVAVPRKGGPFCPVAAWEAWLRAMLEDRPDLSGRHPAFPPLDEAGRHIAILKPVHRVHGGRPATDDTGGLLIDHWEGVSGDEINEIVKRRAVAAGLGIDPTTGVRLLWGGHSLRRGWMTEAARQRISLDKMMAHAGHVSPDVALEYIEEARLFDPEHSAAMLIRFDASGF